MRLTLCGVLVPGLVSLLGGCGGGGGSEAPSGPPPVASISITPSSLTLKVGEGQALTALVMDAKGASLSGRTVTWSVADETIAQVTASTVTARAPGQTVITASAEGKTATATLTVPALPRVTIGVSQPKVFVGETAVITWSTENATTCT